MTIEAKMVIYDILIAAHIRLIGTVGPFWCISEILGDFYKEWGWAK